MKIKDFYLSNMQRGQTIIEATIALALIVVVLGAISVVVILGLNNSTFVKDQTQASKYAQDGMEYIRYLSNNFPGTEEGEFNGQVSNNIYCFNELDDEIQDLSDRLSAVFSVTCNDQPNIEGRFVREVVFKYLDSSCDNGTKVEVTVSWSGGKCESTNRFCHKSELSSCFPRAPIGGVEL